MSTETHYLLRSRRDGRYLVARLRREESGTVANYVLLFQESHDALSYLNAHARGLAGDFTIETLVGTQIPGLLQRWSFQGIGLVTEPLEPRVQFLVYGHGLDR